MHIDRMNKLIDKNTLAPVILFAYNRPWHTQKVIDALLANTLIEKTTIYIFQDGSKNPFDILENNRITEVTRCINNANWPTPPIYTKSKINKGLANSIIDGINVVLKEHDYAIILEDDIELSNGFLKYMNECLKMYFNNEKVMHISGYWFPTKNFYSKSDTFFYNSTSCWGWATWKRAWDKLIVDNDVFKKEILNNPKKKYHFDIEGVADFSKQIEQNISGELNTWAYKWYATVFLNKGLCLHPKTSLVQNIGMDGTGVHFTNVDASNHYLSKVHSEIEVKRIALIESKKARKAIHNYYKGQTKFYQKWQGPFISKIKRILKLKMGIEKPDKYYNLNTIARYQPLTIDLFGNNIMVPDAASFKFMYNEIFEKQIYKFYTSNNSPRIIDAGANIGLSVIFFKRLYPDAIIEAFDPDPKIYSILQNNIQAFKITNVRLHNIGLWNCDKELTFYSEGADGGRIVDESDTSNIIQAKFTSLRPFLNGKTDLLKMDIEGAEDVVIEDIKDLLINVDRVFIEYHSFPNKQQTLSKILTILEVAGFRININTPGLVSQQPFVKVNKYNGMDMQLNIYAFKK